MKYIFVKTPSVEALGVVTSTVHEDVLGVLVIILWRFVGEKPAHVIREVGWFVPSCVHPLVEL